MVKDDFHTNCDSGVVNRLGPQVGLAIQLYVVMLHWYPILTGVLTCGSSKGSYIQKVWKKTLWNSVIILSPVLIGQYAIRDFGSKDPEERLRIYMNGLPEDKSGYEPHDSETDGAIVHSRNKVPIHEVLMHLMSIGLSIYPTIQLFELGVTCTPTRELQTIAIINAQQMQYYTVLPSAIVGLWMFLDARLFRVRSGKTSLAVCFCLLTAVMIVLSVATSLLSKRNEAGYDHNFLPHLS